jgi:septin 2
MDRWEPFLAHVEDAFKQYLNDESKANRKNIEDHRVHACLYFINPLTRGCDVLSCISIGYLSRSS